VRSFVSFALLDLVVAMGLVGDYAAYGTDASANNCADWAADLGAYEGSAHCATCDELGLGVVAMVVAMGLDDGIFVGLLRGGSERQCEDCCGKCGCCECLEFHLASSSGLFCRAPVQSDALVFRGSCTE
jgi:hypothetical protein